MISRRNFLLGSSGAIVTLPWLPSMLRAGQGKMAENAVPARFVAIWSPHGQYLREYWPKFAATKKLSDDVHSYALAGHKGDISNILKRKYFGAHYSKLNLLRGLDALCWPSHNSNTMLGASRGYRSHETIDNFMAHSKNFYREVPYMRALHLRPSWDDRNSPDPTISFRRDGDRIAPLPSYTSAQVAFNRMFFRKTTKGASQVKIVDQVRESYQRLRNSSRIGKIDKMRLDDHISFLSDLEERLVFEANLSCTAPKLVATNQTDSLADMDWNTTYRNHMDLIVAALRCGLTNIATLSFNRESPFFDSGYFHDDVAHNPDETNRKLRKQSVKINRWFAKWVSYLIGQMDQVIEINGKSLLDNSLVYWGNEHGNHNEHSVKGMPVLLAGSASGAIETGRYIDYRQEREIKDPTTSAPADIDALGRPYNQLLTTIMAVFGLQPDEYERTDESDYESSGPGFGQYNVFKKDEQPVYERFLSDSEKRRELPSFRRS